MTRNALLLTLGHNSSAVLVRDHRVVGGYETERLTGVKSDSSFPELPIRRLIDQNNPKGKIDVYVSHWDLHGDVKNMKPKHWNPALVAEVSNGGSLMQVGDLFTHHDAHAWSAIAFCGGEFPQGPKDDTYVFVVDGFGTFGEHMSFYRLIDGLPCLIERKFGFGLSLGLLYQYATAFMGMKQNQDEYKLLAYEAHIDELGDGVVETLDRMVEDEVLFMFRALRAYMESDATDPMLSVGALPRVAANVADMLNRVVESVGLGTASERSRRVACAYFVQKVVEDVMKEFVAQYKPDNLLLVGGVFYNVKLNNVLSKLVPGKTCVMPLAGDQGAAIGLYKAVNQDFEFPSDLFWGPRDLKKSYFDSAEMRDIGFRYFSDKDAAFEEVRKVLSRDGLVNVVDGRMEFGPRALCHTSTLAYPTPEVAKTINSLNDRTNLMPFAPVMSEWQADQFLIDCNKIHKSLDFMVCTRDFKETPELMMGAAHKYPKKDVYSARPQIAREHHMVQLLHEVGPLINTSYNFHGYPIVCTDEQIRLSHVMEKGQSEKEGVPTTIVIGDGK